MCHFSPAVSLLWAVNSLVFLGYLIWHLWQYDRFQCLRWGSGRQPGSFRRFMTYSYLASLPLLSLYCICFSIIKYRQGYMVVPGNEAGAPGQTYAIVPTPYEFWPASDRAWLTPLYFVFSITWALEIITHLEELCFWLFLLHQGPEKSHWFASTEFRVWLLGSILAAVGLPIVTLVTHDDPLKCEAWIFFVGSLVGTVTNVLFLSVLWRFPAFLRHVKAEGATPDVIVRLATFYELNWIRVFFRFLMTVPLFILALDGIQGAHPLNKHAFAVDLMAMLGGIGAMISSAITLLIFFPRSISQEKGYRNSPPSDPAVAVDMANADPYHDAEGMYDVPAAGFVPEGYVPPVLYGAAANGVYGAAAGGVYGTDVKTPTEFEEDMRSPADSSGRVSSDTESEDETDMETVSEEEEESEEGKAGEADMEKREREARRGSTGTATAVGGGVGTEVGTEVESAAIGVALGGSEHTDVALQDGKAALEDSPTRPHSRSTTPMPMRAPVSMSIPMRRAVSSAAPPALRAHRRVPPPPVHPLPAGAEVGVRSRRSPPASWRSPPRAPASPVPAPAPAPAPSPRPTTAASHAHVHPHAPPPPPAGSAHALRAPSRRPHARPAPPPPPSAPVQRAPSASTLHPYVLTFTSPIDLLDRSPPARPPGHV